MMYFQSTSNKLMAANLDGTDLQLYKSMWRVPAGLNLKRVLKNPPLALRHSLRG